MAGGDSELTGAWQALCERLAAMGEPRSSPTYEARDDVPSES